MFFLQVKTRGSQRSAEPQEATQWGEVRAAAPGGEDVLCLVEMRFIRLHLSRIHNRMRGVTWAPFHLHPNFPLFSLTYRHWSAGELFETCPSSELCSLFW